MNGQRFDALARGFSAAQPRRQVISGLMVAGTTAILLPERSFAGNGKNAGKKCDKNKDCTDGAKCKKDTCTCKSGRTECGGKCHDLDKDEKHCGSCGNGCVGNELCTSGVCIDPDR